MTNREAYFDYLTDTEKLQFLSNVKPFDDRLDRLAEASFADFLSKSFIWDATPEGVLYWNDIATRKEKPVNNSESLQIENQRLQAELAELKVQYSKARATDRGYPHAWSFAYEQFIRSTKYRSSIMVTPEMFHDYLAVNYYPPKPLIN